MVTKDELRARVEKLERSNATLRSKAREATRTAKADAERIAELEAENARLQRAGERSASARVPARSAAGGGASARGRGRRSGGGRDPGDAVPPGVAVDDPAPLDEEAETARENLEEHLSGDA